MEFLLICIAQLFLVLIGFLAGMRFTGHRWFCRLGWHRRVYSHNTSDGTYTDWCQHCGKTFKTGIKVIR